MSSRFRIEILSENDRDNIVNLLLNSFFLEEPLAKCLNLGQPMDFAQQLVDDALKDQCSFVIYDQQNNDFVGFCFNELLDRNHQDLICQIQNEKIDFIFQFLNSMHKNIDLFELFQTNRLLHLLIINIRREYRGLNLSSQLISATKQYAKQNDIKAIYAETTSIYSLNSFLREHFQIYHRMNYIDYDSNRLANLHDQCQLVVHSIDK